jgi:hypothetical protein
VEVNVDRQEKWAWLDGWTWIALITLLVALLVYLVVFYCPAWPRVFGLPSRPEAAGIDAWWKYHEHFSTASAVTATVLLLVSVFVIWRLGKEAACKKIPAHPAAAILLLGWVIGPPIWLLKEYMVFYDKISRDQAEHLSHFEELTRNMWVGLVAAMISIYLRKIPGASSD